MLTWVRAIIAFSDHEIFIGIYFFTGNNVYVWRPGEGKIVVFWSRYHPWMLSERRRLYSKPLLLGAFASETIMVLMSFFTGEDPESS